MAEKALTGEYQENYEENGQTKKSCQICKAILKLRVKKLGP